MLTFDRSSKIVGFFKSLLWNKEPGLRITAPLQASYQKAQLSSSDINLSFHFSHWCCTSSHHKSLVNCLPYFLQV